MGSRRRTPPPPPRAAAFDRLYAELPTIDCQGLCHDSCGPIGMTPTEHRRTTQAGVSIPHADDPNSGPLPATCPALTLLKRCAVYGQRPTICRLWGLTESMPCTYGCRPEGGLLSDANPTSVFFTDDTGNLTRNDPKQLAHPAIAAVVTPRSATA